MQWVCSLEIQGLYASAARASGLVPEGRPVVIVREGRVIDGCREAFTAGLLLGSPAHQVLRDVPRAVQIDLAEVRVADWARRWWDRCAAQTPYVEPLEPHQVLLGLPTPDTTAGRALKAEVNQLMEAAAAFGFVAFAGVGSSRLVARAASQATREGYLLRRPGQRPTGDGERLQIVPLGEEARFLAPLPLHYLPVPPDLRRRLQRLGLASIGEAARVPEGEWVRQLGPQGRLVALLSRGIDHEQVRPAYPPRRLSRRIEFGTELRERDLLEQQLNRAVQPLVRQLESRGEGAQLVALILEQAKGPALHAERTLAKLQQATYPIQQALQILLDQALSEVEGEPEVTALTAEVGLIGPMPWQQMDLWDDRIRRERQERLERALSLLHERFPGRVVSIGPRTEATWREQMLQYADPYRWPTRGA